MPTISLTGVRGDAVQASSLPELEYWLRRNYAPAGGVIAAREQFGGQASAPPALETGAGSVTVVHGTDTARPRPLTAQPVIWYGTAQPTAFADGDVFVQTAQVA